MDTDVAFGGNTTLNFSCNSASKSCALSIHSETLPCLTCHYNGSSSNWLWVKPVGTAINNFVFTSVWMTCVYATHKYFVFMLYNAGRSTISCYLLPSCVITASFCAAQFMHGFFMLFYSTTLVSIPGSTPVPVGVCFVVQGHSPLTGMNTLTAGRGIHSSLWH